ncbi:Lactate dehydrogenase [Hyella patelloides LEGE 07179]|uniref:Lactate dehydrogenase n=1 Tax=Hyella patelloides LEGE 07179 TaxID=945734 RepID=A0A563VIK6_9CYAN|nr:ATP-grasp domain-containing protein [Hyella patelloides]VEP11250.1 Lactate dehydrogenase [Hyella patelloides LEGE 07179]
MQQHHQQKLLILGARQMQLPAFQAARELGLFVIAIDPSPHAVGLTLADCSYNYDLADEAAILTVAKQHSIDGILTLAADYPVPMVAKVSQQLNIPGLSKTAAMVSTNKAQMRKVLQTKGITIPQWRETRTLNQALEAVRNFQGGVIVKPADSSGGRGVTLIESDTTDETISKAFYKALNFSQQGKVMVEEFIAGKEISVEAITIKGKTEIVRITDKLTTEAPFFVEIGHSQPSQLSAKEKEQVTQLTLAGIAALEIDNTASHTEIRFSGDLAKRASKADRLAPQRSRDRPYIIEIGARLGGGYITSHLVPLSCGVDLVKATLQLAIGETPNLQPTKDCGSAIRFLRPDPGQVIDIQGVAAAQKVAEITEVVVEVTPGKLIKPLRDATARVGYVISKGKNAIAAIQNAETAKNLIQINTWKNQEVRKMKNVINREKSTTSNQPLTTNQL